MSLATAHLKAARQHLLDAAYELSEAAACAVAPIQSDIQEAQCCVDRAAVVVHGALHLDTTWEEMSS